MSHPRSKRAYATEVADWCASELVKAKNLGERMDYRCYVQNVDLIIEALREYAAKPPQVLKGGWVNVYAAPTSRGSFVTWFDTKEEADASACSNRFACIHIPEITEGDGL